jgi:GNAT superfamily N-acetyltransferase
MRRARDDGYVVSTDPGLLDLDVVHGFLRTAYWSTGIPRETVARALEYSMPFGLYAPDGAQCGFARVVSDRATFAYLGDVFVLHEHRGRGLGVWLVECVLAHPELQGLGKWHLATADAHALYERFGFVAPRSPEAQLFVERPPGELYGVDPM